jgi:hypothetical protein
MLVQGGFWILDQATIDSSGYKHLKIRAKGRGKEILTISFLFSFILEG